MNKELSIILPSYNESKNLPIITERLNKFYPEINFELIIVNNGSSDDTDKILKELCKQYEFLNVVTIKKNIGYGYGIFTGLKKAKADILCYSHADIQTPPEDTIKAYKMIKKQNIDMNKTLIKGLRINRLKEQMFLTKGLAKVVEFFLGHKMEDINGQPKMFSKKLFKELKNPPYDFSFDVYVMYIAKLIGLKLETFPVDFGQRIHGESKWATNIFNKSETIFKYVLSIIKIAFKYFKSPNNLFHQAVKFLATGVLTNITNYTFFYLFLRIINIHYIISSIIGFLTGFVLGFIINRKWTFSIADKVSNRLIKYLILNLFSLSVNTFSIWFFTDITNIIPEISQVIAIAISTIINFIGSKVWVFK